MSALQDSTILVPTRFSTTKKGQLRSLRSAPRTLRKATSLAALYDVARHPVKTLEGVRNAVEEWYDGLGKEEREQKVLQDARKRALYLQQRSATTLAEWEEASMELDWLENNNAWKQELDSPDYDPRELLAQLNQLQDARFEGDVKRMLYLIRTTLSRNTAQMGNLKLYQYSHLGTKEIVERYIQTTLDTIDALVDACDRSSLHGISTQDIYNNFLAARQSFGRSALLLSGGGTFGMNHIGVVKALWEVKLLPRIVSGASAGSIVAAVTCTTTDEEYPELLENFCHGDLAVFEAPEDENSWLKRLARILTIGSMFDVAHLNRVMQGLLGNLTFLEAYNRTRKILNICVSSSSIYELPKLLNYITSPHVVIWSAVAASCSVPVVFSPASLQVKNPKTQVIGPWDGNLTPQKWIDGSVENDIPMQRLSEMFNVNHFIVSQVNPHVVPFLIKEKDINLNEDEHSTFAPSPSWLQGLSTFAKSEAIHRMTTLAEAGFMPNILTKTASVLSQTYSGDITILPEVSFVDFPKVLSNPTPDFILDAMGKGERATWPKLSRIRNHCAIELALDNAANQVRARAVFSQTQASVRRQTFKRTQSDDGRLQFLPRRSRVREKSLQNEPAIDVFEIKKDLTTAAVTPSHQKADSIQTSDLLARAALPPSLTLHEASEKNPRLQAEEPLSSGPGLTSDVSDGDDDSSLSDREETDVTEPRVSPFDQILTMPKYLKSTSVPTSPSTQHKHSPLPLHFTASPKQLTSDPTLAILTPPNSRRDSGKPQHNSDTLKARLKSQSEPESAERLGGKKPVSDSKAQLDAGPRTAHVRSRWPSI